MSVKKMVVVDGITYVNADMIHKWINSYSSYTDGIVESLFKEFNYMFGTNLKYDIEFDTYKNRKHGRTVTGCYKRMEEKYGKDAIKKRSKIKHK